MRKIILLLFVFFYTKNFGQSLTYTIQAEFMQQTTYYNSGLGLTGCKSNTYNWTLLGAIDNQYFITSFPTFTSKTYTIPVNTIYYLTTQASCDCTPNIPSSGLCTKQSTQTIKTNSTIFERNEHLGEGIDSSIQTGSYALGPNQGTPFGMVMLKNFTPNGITVSRIKTTDVCAGEDVELQALIPSTTQTFPDVAFHWEYSLDNQVTWVDVPANFNNKKIPNFTIYDLLGDDHVNHFGAIDFRIGYAGRPFSANALRINYTPCAPVVTDVNYQGPKCNGDGIQKLEVFFNDPLNDTKGESLSQLYVRETINNTQPIKTTPMMEVNNITYPSRTKTYSYSNFSSFTSLENGREYEIIYQAQINDPHDITKKIQKGVMVSTKKFTYYEPQALTFEVTPTNPSCNNNNGTVSIIAHGGSGEKYDYFIDSGVKIPFSSNTIETTSIIDRKQIVTRTGIQNVLLPVSDPKKEYSIKVTDTNGCIDKTATP
jgi:hypothetical protein